MMFYYVEMTFVWCFEDEARRHYQLLSQDVFYYNSPLPSLDSQTLTCSTVLCTHRHAWSLSHSLLSHVRGSHGMCWRPTETRLKAAQTHGCLCDLIPRQTQGLHYMTKSMWTPVLRTSQSKIMAINMELVPSFAGILASTLLGRLSSRCWNIALGTFFHSATRALVRSGTDVGWLGLARSRRSNSSQRFSMGLR